MSANIKIRDVWEALLRHREAESLLDAIDNNDPGAINIAQDLDLTRFRNLLMDLERELESLETDAHADATHSASETMGQVHEWFDEVSRLIDGDSRTT